VWPLVVGPSVTTALTDFSFQNLGFLDFLGIFSSKNHLKNQYLPNISIEILPNKFL
jgi:hypothetical protein